MAGNGWQISEADSFARGVGNCGGHQVIEEDIAAVKLGISRNPEGFQPTHRAGIYLAKTELHWRGPEIVPAYSIWFRVISETREVELLWVEWSDPDATDWTGEDDEPF
ncbi:hypothetical protein [Sulfitobacter sp. THAF37]|uniref:hypothetical protein n=1 Tax=Sulfitobacter sp. THAF37 TaxID=2587855 RepID=UPI001561C8BB|nr:hypothetical protein [Sulfitobacter sp. THAF37]